MAGSTWQWFYREFGLASVVETGLDAWLIILARSSRMFAYGACSVFIALFFTSLGFSDFRIGLFMSLTLAGDVVLTLLLTLLADSLGRRAVLFTGSALMVCSGLTFMVSKNYWVLLLASIIGVISPSGGDFGPFRAIEESILSQLTTPESRSNVLSWYVTMSALGSAIGTEAAGRFVDLLRAVGYNEIEAYHAIFGMYVVFGLFNMVCVWKLSGHAELEVAAAAEEEGMLLQEQGVKEEEPAPAKSRFAQLSPATRSIMYKLWFLLAADSLADGCVGYSLTSYFFAQKFDMAPSTLGDIVSIGYLLAAVSTVFAGALANRIGLVNTMVFTHVPSSLAVLLFPFPSSVVWTIVLFFIRVGLNNMDQAPRAALIAAVVKNEERTAANGITSLVRTLASAIGPALTGGLAEKGQFWVAYVLAGSLRLAYDFGLWALFINIDLYKYETPA
jgi:MFS family permease